MVGSVKIPKRIGAVKISKKVRRKAKQAIRTAASPLMRDFATAAMAAAGRASGNGGGASRVNHETRIHVDGSKVVDAFRTAAADGIRRFLEGLEEGLREAGAWTDAKPAAAAAPAKPAKPKKAATPKATAKPKAAAKPKPAARPKVKKAAPSASKARRAPGP
jgi:hypothetical protein